MVAALVVAVVELKVNRERQRAEVESRLMLFKGAPRHDGVRDVV